VSAEKTKSGETTEADENDGENTGNKEENKKTRQ
jgi:hypothetical protein